MVQTIPLADVHIDTRLCMDGSADSEEVIADEVEKLRDSFVRTGKYGYRRPIVFYSEDEGYYLATGFPLLPAAEQLGLHELSMNVVRGTRWDALLFAASEKNPNRDAATAVRALLKDAEGVYMTDSQISEVTGYTRQHVGRIRKQLEGFGEIPVARSRKGARGRYFTLSSGKHPRPSQEVKSDFSGTLGDNGTAAFEMFGHAVLLTVIGKQYFVEVRGYADAQMTEIPKPVVVENVPDAKRDDADYEEEVPSDVLRQPPSSVSPQPLQPGVDYRYPLETGMVTIGIDGVPYRFRIDHNKRASIAYYFQQQWSKEEELGLASSHASFAQLGNRRYRIFAPYLFSPAGTGEPVITLADVTNSMGEDRMNLVVEPSRTASPST